MIVYKCDLCGELKDCLPKKIEGKIYDICADCWTPLAKKLEGKGRPTETRETVFLTPPSREAQKEKKEPFPGQPPEIQYRSDGPTRRM